MPKTRLLVIVAALLAASVAAAWLAAEWLVVRRPLAKADALVVLGGAKSYRERVRRAAELWRQGLAPAVVINDDRSQLGWSNADERNLTARERTARFLARSGVPARDIQVLPAQTDNTFDEAVALLRYARTRGFRSLILVTSPYHSRRALRTFDAVFRDSRIAIGIEPVVDGIESPPAAYWWLKRNGWRFVPSEYLKLAYYAIRHR